METWALLITIQQIQVQGKLSSYFTLNLQNNI